MSQYWLRFTFLTNLSTWTYCLTCVFQIIKQTRFKYSVEISLIEKVSQWEPDHLSISRPHLSLDLYAFNYLFNISLGFLMDVSKLTFLSLVAQPSANFNISSSNIYSNLVCSSASLLLPSISFNHHFLPELL